MRDLPRPGHRIWPLVALLLGAFGACSLEGLNNGVRSPPDAGADGGPTTPSGDGGGDADAPDPRCPSSTCIVVREGERRPSELAILGSRLYWLRAVADGRVVGSDLDGKNLTVEDDHPVATPHDLVVAPIGVAFALSDDGVLKRYLDYSTCNSATGVLRLSMLGSDFFLAKSDGVYRGDCGGNVRLATEDVSAVAGDGQFGWYARKNGEIVRCEATSANCATTRTVLASGQGAVAALAHDTSRVYWITPTSGGAEIRARTKLAVGTAGAPETLASGKEPRALAATGAALYWTDLRAGTVHVTDVDTKQTRTLAAGLRQPWGIAALGDHVYVAENDDAGRILRVDRR